MKRFAALSLLCGILLLNASTAQDTKTPANPAPPKPQRTHYVVRNADPVVLADAVGKHFKGDAEVIATPPGSGNALLISGSKETVAEVVKLLEELDTKPRTVEVEVAIVEVPAVKDGKSVDVTANLDEFLKANPVQRIKLTTVEGQQVSTTTGGNKPIVSGTTIVGGGGFGGGGKGGIASKSITYHAVGTTVKTTARVGTNDTISLDLNVQESKVRPPEAGDENTAPALDHSTLNTKLNIPTGKAVAAQTVRAEGKTGNTISVVIVTARVVDLTAPPPRGK
jgi:type II secretory pathway component GspD/PulD (secretin)